MASSTAHTKRQLKRSLTKKSHSWWWDSHISPKNSRWLADNLQQMDDHVKRMLKLIEEDADSFAQKAQMYYQKRPELINLVEEFYRMYRSLAERYDHVTGELRRNLPSGLHSQDSLELSPSTHQKLSRHLSETDATHSPDAVRKEDDDSSSSTDSASESDSGSDSDRSSSANSFPGLSVDQALTRRIADLETELCEAKQKLLMQQEVSAGGSVGSFNSDSSVDLRDDKIAMYERELREANERLRISEEEIAKLKTELQKYKPCEIPNDAEDSDREEAEDAAATKFQLLEEELRIAKAKLQQSEEEIFHLKNELEITKAADDEKLQSLQHKLEWAQKDASTYKSKLNAEKKELSKLQERMAMLKSSLQDRDYEIRALKIAVSDAEEKIFPEKAQIKAEMAKLAEERSHVEEQLKEMEARGRSLEDEIRRISNEKAEMEERLRGEMEERGSVLEKLEEKISSMRREKDGLRAEIAGGKEEVRRRDETIGGLERHMEELHREQAKLVARMEEMRGRGKELEEEVKRQSTAIREGAEQKREAIRQLCFSLDHYRNGYVRLRKTIAGHKRVAISAS